MSSATYFKVGVFVILATVLGTVGLIVLAADEFQQETSLFETYLDESVNGLETGSPVKARGVALGQVTDIDFAMNRYDTKKPLIYVQFEIREDSFVSSQKGKLAERMRQRIEGGLRVRLTTAGITGGMYLDLDTYEDAEDPEPISWKPETTYIPSMPSILKTFTDKAEELLDDLNRADIGGISEGLQGVLASTQEAIEGDLAVTMENMRLASERMPELVRSFEEKMNDRVLVEMDGLVKDLRAVVNEDVKGALGGIEAAAGEIAADLKEFLETAEGATGEQMVAIIKNLRETSDALPETLSGLNDTIRRIDTAVAGQQSGLGRSVKNVERLTEDLREILEPLKRNPSRLLFGEAPRQAEAVRKR